MDLFIIIIFFGGAANVAMEFRSKPNENLSFPLVNYDLISVTCWRQLSDHIILVLLPLAFSLRMILWCLPL